MRVDRDRIHQAVRERYGGLAESAGSCCGPGDSAGDGSCCEAIYEVETLKGLPEEVSGLSLGCGDPVTLAGLQPGETVLDLGSGGGLDCFLAARNVGPEGRVIGVDMTEAMISKAEGNRIKLGLENVEFRLGHIEDLPVEDDRVDVILSNCVINLSPDKAAVFGEAYRVLKPGGRISVSDIVSQGTFSPELQSDMDQWAACVAGAVDQEEYLALMAQAGFVDLEVTDRVSAEGIVERREGMPPLYSVRITGRKPG